MADDFNDIFHRSGEEWVSRGDYRARNTLLEISQTVKCVYILRHIERTCKSPVGYDSVIEYV